MLTRRNMWFRLGLALFVVGASFVIFPPYKQYCESDYSNQYGCVSYEILAFFAAFAQRYNGAIAAVATAFIAWFTFTIWETNKIQLEHDRAVERAYLWPGFGKHKRKKGGMKWHVTVTNTGRMAGVLRIIFFAVITEEEFKAGGYEFDIFTNREDVIPPGTGNPGQETGLDFDITEPMVCCGWIEYEDIFGRDRKQGWKHRLRLTKDSAGNWSIPFPDCYSAAYRPWEGKNRANTEVK